MVAKEMTQTTVAGKKNTEQDRTLYIRFPKTIKSMDEVRNLIVGDADIKLPRQASRNCHVVFSTVKDKINNFKTMKEKIKNDKSGILVSCPKLNHQIQEKTPKVEKTKEEKEKRNEKLLRRKLKKLKQKSLNESKPKTANKPVLPKILSKTIIVMNIPVKTNLPEVKEAFPNCQSASWIASKNYKGKKPVSGRAAIIKLPSSRIVKQYLLKKRTWPIVHGEKVLIKADKRKTLKPKIERPEPSVLKIYDDGKDVSEQLELKKKPRKAKSIVDEPEPEEENEDVDEEEEEEDVEDDSETEEQEDSEAEDNEDEEENENSDEN